MNQSGKEGALAKAFEKQVQDNGDPDIRYIGFDFHHKCKNMQYENLSFLIQDVQGDLQHMEYFSAEVTGDPREDSLALKTLTMQKAVFRTNCMDSLDRTNVVQSVLARTVLLAQFQTLGVSASNGKVF